MSIEFEALEAEVARLRRENAELRQRLGMAVAEPSAAYAAETPELPLAAPPTPQVTHASPVQDKIKLFRSLFRGLEDIISMQCGPIRHRMAERRSVLRLKLHVRETAFAMPPDIKHPIQQTFGALVPDEARNALIERDVLEALEAGRNCLILSHRREHCRLLAERLAAKGKAPFVLNGSQGKKERTAILKAIQETPADKDLAVVATGQYLGEGFDCPRLDTLFMAFPVSFKGKLVQYAGRILRELPGKATAEIYDYVDPQVPELKHMFFRRHRAYKALGFEINGDSASDWGGRDA